MQQKTCFILLLSFFGFGKTYIVYCPCMGRFGNQADQFLGTLYFAKQINRTLILPPFIEYVYGRDELTFVPVEELFQLSELKKYHDVIPMGEFMKDVAPGVWPVGSRKVLCYTTRENNKKDCGAKDGRPFGHFWNHFHVDFDQSVSYEPLGTSSTSEEWSARFPIDKFPVIAFMGAPGAFPIQPHAIPLHQHLVWTPKVDAEAESIISDHLEHPFVAVHLRNDIDFKRACQSTIQEMRVTQLFDSSQCHGFNENGPGVTMQECYPSTDLVVAHVRQAMDSVGARALYVATDRDDLASEFQANFGAKLVRFTSSLRLRKSLYLDLALLGRADMAVLNCISSFSAFAGRERKIRGLPTEYLGFTRLVKPEL